MCLYAKCDIAYWLYICSHIIWTSKRQKMKSFLEKFVKMKRKKTKLVTSVPFPSLSLSLSPCFISPFIPFPAAQSQPPWNHCHIIAFNWLWLAQHWHYAGIATPMLFLVVPLHSLSVSIMFHHPSANQLSSQTTFKRAVNLNHSSCFMLVQKQFFF